MIKRWLARAWLILLGLTVLGLATWATKGVILLALILFFVTVWAAAYANFN